MPKIFTHCWNTNKSYRGGATFYACPVYKSVWTEGSAVYNMSTATLTAHCRNITNSATSFAAHTYVPCDAPLFAAQSCETGSATVSSCLNTLALRTPHSNLLPRLSPNTKTCIFHHYRVGLKNWTILQVYTSCMWRSRKVPHIYKMFSYSYYSYSSLSRIRLLFWMPPHLNILCTSSEKHKKYQLI